MLAGSTVPCLLVSPGYGWGCSLSQAAEHIPDAVLGQTYYALYQVGTCFVPSRCVMYRTRQVRRVLYRVGYPILCQVGTLCIELDMPCIRQVPITEPGRHTKPCTRQVYLTVPHRHAMYCASQACYALYQAGTGYCARQACYVGCGCALGQA